MSPHTAFGLGILASLPLRWVATRITARVYERFLARVVATRDAMVTAAIEHHDDDVLDRELRIMTDHHPDDALEPYCTHCDQPWPCIPARAIGIETA